MLVGLKYSEDSITVRIVGEIHNLPEKRKEYTIGIPGLFVGSVSKLSDGTFRTSDNLSEIKLTVEKVFINDAYHHILMLKSLEDLKRLRSFPDFIEF